MALTTVAKVKAWAEPSLDTTRDSEITRIIAAVAAWLPRATGRIIEQATLTRYFDGGEDAQGHKRDTIYLPSGHRPVAHSGSDLVTVTEDGVSLTVAVGYSTSADVIVTNADIDLPCSLVRNGTAWSDSVPQNIKVVYKAGFATIGAEIEQLANELAYREFKQPGYLARASASRAEHSVAWDDEFTAESRLLLQRLTVL